MATTTTLGYDDLPALLTRPTGDEKHDRSSLSTLDVLWVLYDRILRDEDRFLLSKGHGPAAFYAVLAAKGIVPVSELDGFGSFDSRLGYHPDRVVAPGVEFSSGSLGHGLGVAVGSALSGRRVFCLVGDGELDEGSNWEAVQYAGRIGLGSLTAIVIDNDSAALGWPEGIERRFMLEGWVAQRVDGRDHDALEAALSPVPVATRPRCVVAEVETR
ncbi:MAG TPA: 1-deoxy-D-xylulose-5-phosphate synthase N-terminal domain-containing protein [Gaiellaceae bacterium]|nr:1-deoxy-D-xylulose-5-phosphate synthase N-terminal domain-containing protein [Gaiellaceae bacterium]